MTNMHRLGHFSRRTLLKGAGAVVVSVGMPIGLDTALAINSAFAQGARPPLVPDQLASYIAINADGSVAAFFGKMDMGQGLYVSIAQMVAEELDVPFDRVKVLMADTRTSVNQGGASGSTGIQHGGKQMRAAAAEARRVLVEMAAEKLGVAADALTVTDGVVHAKSDAAKKASYAELIGGRYFNVQLEWNKQVGNLLYAPGKAKPKDPKDYKIVGQPIKRADVAPKAFALETRSGTRSRRSRRSRSSGRTRRRRSPSKRRSTSTSARRRCASARTSSRSATSTRRSRPPPA